jgi:fructose-specific phosphotransferase system IIA component
MQRTDLTTHLRQELFLEDMKASNKGEALSELLDLFIKGKYIRNRDIALEMLYQRETLGSTGIGKGIAIPHGRTTATTDVVIAFGKSGKGIDFDAIDGKPVHLFFMVIAPPNDEDNTYLPVLGSLVTLLNNARNRNKLLKVETYEELTSLFTGE